VGFAPDLTGDENIYLSTSLFRISRRQTDALYRDIVEFSNSRTSSTFRQELLDWHVCAWDSRWPSPNPEILLIDEVLAVGDERFQAKCIEKMQAMRRAGTTIVFVSHSMGAVETMCDRAVLLLNGRVQIDGSPKQVIGRYRKRQLRWPRLRDSAGPDTDKRLAEPATPRAAGLSAVRQEPAERALLLREAHHTARLGSWIRTGEGLSRRNTRSCSPFPAGRRHRQWIPSGSRPDAIQRSLPAAQPLPRKRPPLDRRHSPERQRRRQQNPRRAVS
jgi:hypothetical protein